MKCGLVVLLAAALALSGCGREERFAPGDTYRRISRPEVWRALPYGQAETLGFEPGDLLIVYNREPVRSNDAVVAAQARASGAPSRIPVTVLRDGREVEFEVEPGPVGVMPVAARHPSGLAVALEDILRALGMFADYDWLAALTGESFTLAAAAGECRAWWSGGAAGSYLDDIALMAGFELTRVYSLADGGNGRAAVRAALDAGRHVLVRGGWPGHRGGFWGVAVRHDPELDAVFGYTLDSAEEMPLAGGLAEAYVIEAGPGWDDADEVLALVLNQALELGYAREGDGWETGLAAYDLLITSLDTVPFCPVCGEGESPVCFGRLVWSMVAHKESAIRFLTAMREAAPDQAALIDEIVGDLQAQVGKLEGIARSGARIGRLEDQRRIARVIAEIQVIENDLLGLYEQLLVAL
ncbi:MAG: hypothetical protein R6X12_01810 [bacterium]